MSADPTRTATLRRNFILKVRGRLHKIKMRVVELIVTQDAFGLNRFTDAERLARALSPRLTVNRFEALTDPQKAEEFQAWLAQELEQEITATKDQEKWWKEFVERGYKQGAGRAFQDAKGIRGNGNFDAGTREDFLRASFAQPVAVGKVQFLASRVFTELKGVTALIEKQLTRALVDGMARGENPRTIASRMVKEIDGITRRNAETIARTETIRAHAEGQLDAFESLGVSKIGVAAEWSTADDARVCKLCSALEGVVLSVTEARGLIPRHPNCRCAFIPANVGEDTSKQKRKKKDVDAAIEESLRRESPKKNLKTARARSSWGGADVKIKLRRPKSIFGDPPKTKRKAGSQAQPDKGTAAGTKPKPAKTRKTTPGATGKRKAAAKPEKPPVVVKQRPPRRQQPPDGAAGASTAAKAPKPPKPQPVKPSPHLGYAKADAKGFKPSQFQEEVWKEIGDGVKSEEHARKVGKMVMAEVDKRVPPMDEYWKGRMAHYQSKIDEAVAKGDQVGIKAWTEMRDMIKNRDRLRVMKEVMQEVRDFGGKIPINGAADVVEGVEKSLNNFPKKWLDEASKKKTLTAEASTDRAYYSPGQAKIVLNSNPGLRPQTTTTHELTHWIEETYDGSNGQVKLGKLEQQFIDRRAKGEKLEQIYPNSAEYGYKDDFKHHYIGKIYNHTDNHREVMSMGMEGLFHENHGIAGDEDMVEFVVGVLAGL
jgi:SPP1 gp7 family putative phage head morphogenesis protein